MRRSLRMYGVQAVAVVAIVALGLVVGQFLLGQQRITPPSWVPLIGQSRFHLSARFTTAAGVAPGQGQAVTISGVRVGEVAGVDLDRGTAVVRMTIQPRFAGRIHPNATLLLRPKTPVKDMVVELDPGTPAGGPPVADGTTFGTDRTKPDVNLDEVLAMLDVDTREALSMVANQGGVAVSGGGGRQLGRVVQDLEPLTRRVALASRYVAQRPRQLRRLVHNLSAIAEQLGGRDRQVGELVRSTSDVFGRLADQSQALGASVDRLPATLGATDQAIGRIGRLSQTLRTAVPRVMPGAKALPAALAELRPFLAETTPVLRDQLRPFSREARPTFDALAPVVRTLSRAAPDLRKALSVLDAATNALGYDPPGDGPGDQSYLFHLAWAGHNTDSVLSTQDGVGATRRTLLYVPCTSLKLLTEIVPKYNPAVAAVVGLLNLPATAECTTKVGG